MFHADNTAAATSAAPTATAPGDRKNWIAVASAEHVRLGRAAGFMQVCHGKPAPLRRIRPGDAVVYYSPAEQFGSKLPLRAFTAIGTALPAAPYEVEMHPGFRPWRRKVAWLPAREVPIAPLLDRLAFSAGKRNWAYPMRFGLFEIDGPDMLEIARAMDAALPG